MRILIVTNNHLFSLAINSIIKNQFLDSSIHETHTVRQAIELMQEVQCVAMILDIGVPDAMDTDLLEELKKRHPRIPVLVNLGERTQFMHKFIRAGATALFSNKSSPEDIYEGLRNAQNQIRYVSPDIQQQLLYYILEKPINRTLTKREEWIADLLVASKSHQDIAQVTGSSSKSIGYYKRQIFKKLEVDNLVDLAIKLNKVSVNKDIDY